jgi:predicted Fe-S protein YdhL (DUF1289 family)
LNSSRELLKKAARRVAAGEVAAVPSPCVSVCRMNMDTDLCEGCLRTLDEIAAWGRMSEDDKRDVWAALAKRLDDEEKA